MTVTDRRITQHIVIAFDYWHSNSGWKLFALQWLFLNPLTGDIKLPRKPPMRSTQYLERWRITVGKVANTALLFLSQYKK